MICRKGTLLDLLLDLLRAAYKEVFTGSRNNNQDVFNTQENDAYF